MKSTSGLSIWPEELPGVRRQRLDVAALALGEDGVEGEARLARPGQPGEDDQRVARELERDVLEVVLAGTSDDELVSHRMSSRIGCGQGGRRAAFEQTFAMIAGWCKRLRARLDDRMDTSPALPQIDETLLATTRYLRH